ncbi:hypothetical protein B0H19DRAFT_1079541 [Mycena capillaripes]|nr:hypothetical protein B0H19DRAFT_1079541 [Mycena capillaripes]
MTLCACTSCERKSLPTHGPRDRRQAQCSQAPMPELRFSALEFVRYPRAIPHSGVYRAYNPSALHVAEGLALLLGCSGKACTMFSAAHANATMTHHVDVCHAARLACGSSAEKCASVAAEGDTICVLHVQQMRLYCVYMYRTLEGCASCDSGGGGEDGADESCAGWQFVVWIRARRRNWLHAKTREDESLHSMVQAECARDECIRGVAREDGISSSRNHCSEALVHEPMSAMERRRGSSACRVHIIQNDVMRSIAQLFNSALLSDVK